MSGNTNTDILLAGAFAAFTVDICVYPLDTLKTRFQSPDYKKLYYNASKTAINRPVLFRGLYQGVGSVVLITIPSSGAFFTTYEAVKTLLKRVNPTLDTPSRPLVPDPFIHSAASAIAELVSCFILTPAEVLKQNAQMIRQPVEHSSTKTSATFQPSATLEVLKQFKRPSQLWRGYTALAARNLPFTAMQFPMFEHLKVTIKNHRRKIGIATESLLETAIVTAVSAGSAGSVAAVVTTPVDVVKTRIMLSAAGERSQLGTNAAAKAGAIGKEVARKSGFTVAREVFRDSGVKGLFRGAVLRGTWTALGSGLYLGTYESGKVFLGDQRRTEDL